MRILTSFVTGTALLMTAGLLGCNVDTDPFDTLTSTATLGTTMTQGDGDGDDTSTTASGDGDGDTATGDGDGDGEPGDGDGDTGCTPGTFNCPCGPGDMCDDGLSCVDGTCTLGGGDGDGDGDGDTGGDCNTYDPMMCAPPGALLMVGDIEGNFCSCPCATNADCPMGPQGTTGACALSTMGGEPEFCALVCTPGGMDVCPAGSSCKDVPNQMGVGLCTYP
jgi:hypothetical protein